MDKKIRLPREGFIDDKDPEGLVALPTDDDVEGHRINMNTPEDFTVLPPPPGIGLNRSPGHGGEARDSSDDGR
jgi:hypothetical protein